MDKIKEHIKNKEFGLKDFNNSFNKYKEYKKEKVNLFFDNYEEEIKTYLEEDLFDFVFNDLDLKIKDFNYLDLFKKPLNKTMINHLSTIINGLTRERNINFVDNLENLNKNEVKTFTIILYLKFYKEINKTMNRVLVEYLKNYEKKAIINKL